MYLDVFYVDHSGNEARTRHYPPEGTTVSEVFSGVQSLASKLDTVTTASISRVKVYLDVPFSPSHGADTTSDVYTRCILLFREGDSWTEFYIPSPYNLPFDAEGLYRGIRVQRDAMEVSGMLEELEYLASSFTSPTRASGDYHFVVGGITKVIP